MLSIQGEKSGLGLFINEADANLIDFEHEGIDEGFFTRWRGLIQKNDGTFKGHVIMMNTLAAQGPFMEEVEASIFDSYVWPLGKVKWRSLFDSASKIDLKPFLGKYQLTKR